MHLGTTEDCVPAPIYQNAIGKGRKIKENILVLPGISTQGQASPICSSLAMILLFLALF